MGLGDTVLAMEYADAQERRRRSPPQYGTQVRYDHPTLNRRVAPFLSFLSQSIPAGASFSSLKMATRVAYQQVRAISGSLCELHYKASAPIVCYAKRSSLDRNAT
jgi:hypothetical protein